MITVWYLFKHQSQFICSWFGLYLLFVGTQTLHLVLNIWVWTQQLASVQNKITLLTDYLYKFVRLYTITLLGFLYLIKLLIYIFLLRFILSSTRFIVFDSIVELYNHVRVDTYLEQYTAKCFIFDWYLFKPFLYIWITCQSLVLY